MYLDPEVIGGALLRLEENGNVVVHHVRAGVKNHVHQRCLALVSQPVYKPPLGHFPGVIAHGVLACAQRQYQDIVVVLHNSPHADHVRTIVIQI